MRFEYKLIPAPAEPPRIKGVRGASARYARGLEDTLNEMAGQGWEYVRVDRVPVTASRGFLRRKEERDETLLVFRRERAAPAARATASAPSIVAEPPLPEAEPAPAAEPADEVPSYMRPRAEPAPRIRPARPIAARRDD